MLEALGGLLAIESVAEHGKEGLPFGPGPARALEYTLSLCEALGFRVKNAGGLYGYAEAGQGEKVIGVLSHLDVVPAGNGWTVPPFAGTVRDGRLYGRLYGRGSVDDKGPAVVCTYALRDLLDAYGGPCPSGSGSSSARPRRTATGWTWMPISGRRARWTMASPRTGIFPPSTVKRGSWS